MYKIERKYYLLIREYKEHAVHSQNYELAICLRDIEVLYFEKKHSRYIGFNENDCLKMINEIKNCNGSEFVKRDMKLRILLDSNI